MVLETISPFQKSVSVFGGMSPVRRRRSVDFPDPLAPLIANSSPLFREKKRPEKRVIPPRENEMFFPSNIKKILTETRAFGNEEFLFEW